MRVSCDVDDEGYAPLAVRHCKVFLDGVERCHVITADEEKRMAILHVLDEHGRPKVDRGEIKRETFYGNVRVELDAVARERLQRFGALR